MRRFLNRLAAFLTNSLNQRLRDLKEAFDNESTAIKQQLFELKEGFDSQSTAVNERLERFEGLLTREQPAAQALKSAHEGSIGNSLADIDLIERYSHDWKANAPSYQQALGTLRLAAQRLLLLRDAHTLPDGAVVRLRQIQDEISCLARQPLFFPEMFHAVRLQPDGSFSPIHDIEFMHMRSGGLLGLGDRSVIEKIYRRLFESRSAPLRVVEIGTAAGRGSTRIGGEYVKRSGGTLYCVDPHGSNDWGGTRGYLAFLANLRIFEFESTVFPIRAGSVEAAALFDDGSLDGAFLDGSHLYADVLADIDAYLPKIRQGGLLFGHDLHGVPSRFDREELLKISDQNNADVTYTNPDGRMERRNAHLGVVLAVQDRFGDAVETFPDSSVWVRRV